MKGPDLTNSNIHDISRTNQHRCQQILECKQQILFWRSKLGILEAEQTECFKKARLRLYAKSSWRSLSSTEKLEKKFILAGMESKEGLPKALDSFPNSDKFPLSIRTDKEIILARVRRRDFAGKYDDDENVLYLPQKLSEDKEVIMNIIPKHSAVIKCMSRELRNDTEIFRIFLKTNPTLPTCMLQYFSHRIRSDRKLMLELCAHRDGISCLSFLPTDYRDDKLFIMEAIEASYSNSCNKYDSSNLINTSKLSRTQSKVGKCRETHQILRYVSQRLQNDPEAVLAAVRMSGLNLKYASYQLRRDRNIVMTAIEENDVAFRYCLPGDVKDELLSNRSMILKYNILENVPTTVLKMLCLEQFQMDQEIIVEALRCGIDWSLVPSLFQQSREFAKIAVLKNPCSYRNLSESFRKDVQVARTAIESESNGLDDSVLLDATEQCPALLSDRDLMLKIVKKCRSVNSLHIILQLSPITIHEDKEIMLEAIKNDPSAFQFCSKELFMDRDIVFMAVGSSPSYLYLLPSSYQVENSEIVVRAIMSTNNTKNLRSLYENVCKELWSNRDVGMAWLSKGGVWLDEDFPDNFQKDKELCLTLAEHKWSNFKNVSVELRCDKEFMLNAIMADARVIRDIIDTSDQLCYDYDLLLLAFSRDKRTIQFYSGADDLEFMVSFTKKVRKRIEYNDIFNRVVLGNICRQPIQHSCPLSLLNQGSCTIKQYTNIIASYLGLPDEEKVCMLREASRNLLYWGF